MKNKIPQRITIERVANGFVIVPADMDRGFRIEPMMVAESTGRLRDIVGSWGSDAEKEFGDFDTFSSDTFKGS